MRRLKKQRKYLYDEPFFLQWHITNQCNLSCLHCYKNIDINTGLSSPDLLLILDKYERFLKTIKRCGRIQFTGGEPFLSPHLFTLIEEARKRKIPCRILSNGVGITESDIDKLANTKCRLVQISIEGDRTTNDRIRGEGTFKKAMETIKLLREKGIEVTVNMTVSKMNIEDVESVMHIASQHADRFTLSRFVPINKIKSININDALNPTEVDSCFKKVFIFKSMRPTLDIPLRDPLWHGFLRVSAKRYKHDIHGCSAGFNGLTADYDGTIYPCRRLPLPIGNILKMELIDIWNNSSVLNELRNRDLLKGKCNNCERRWLCGGCRAVAYALREDYLEEDPQCPYASS